MAEIVKNFSKCSEIIVSRIRKLIGHNCIITTQKSTFKSLQKKY